MKKAYLFVLLLLSLAVLSSCNPRYSIPYGKWKSDDPDIMLDIISEFDRESTGIFIQDGEIRDVFVSFKNASGFYIQDMSAYYFNEDRDKWIVNGSNWYFVGEFKIKDGKMYYNARCSDGLDHQGKYEEKTIIFELIEAYDPPPEEARDNAASPQEKLREAIINIVLPFLVIIAIYSVPIVYRKCKKQL